MTLSETAFTGARIHDGKTLFEDHAFLLRSDGTCPIVPRSRIPASCAVKRLEGGVICPGFVDLQVNGGGGVMFNDDQSVNALRQMAQAHRRSGTVALLPTLITDTAARTRRAIETVIEAMAQNVKGIAGLHLEGPHLSIARKGAHDPALIRPMTDEDLEMLLDAAQQIPNLMVTVAPENTTNAQIKALAEAGIVVSLGHTDADFESCMAAFDAGARCATHLFNAMSQMGNRAPGLVGAVLARDDIHAGLIADGVHVHPATIRIALQARQNPEKIFLVTDAMATAGSQIDHFEINGRKVLRRNRRLTLQDGTLAGADLEMPRALALMTQEAGDSLQTALARASATPASLLNDAGSYGTLCADPDNVLYLDDSLETVEYLSAILHT